MSNELDDKFEKIEKDLKRLTKRIEKLEHLLLYIPASLLIGGGLIGIIFSVFKYLIQQN